MRSWWLPVLGWCAATLASVAAGMVALQPVLRAAAPGVAVPGDAPPAVLAPPDPPVATASPTAAPSARASAGPSPTARRSPAPGTGTAATSSPQATVVDGWTVTRGPDGTPTYLRSFRVAGGQAVIRMTPGRVELVTATPSDGYAVDTVQQRPDNLAVQFTERDHYFVIHALWHDDAPFAQVSEVGG